MDKYGKRMMVNRVTAVISLILIIALVAVSIASLSGHQLNDPEVHFYKISNNEFGIELTYDVDMVGGTIGIDVTEGSVTNEVDVLVGPRKDDPRTVTGTFVTKDAFTDPAFNCHGLTTDVRSSGQMSVYMLTLIGVVPIVLVLTLTIVRSLTTSVRTYHAEERVVVLYCGMARHELNVDGYVVADANTWIPFMTADMDCIVGDMRMHAEISMMNSPTLDVNGYAVEGVQKNALATDLDS